MRRSGVGRWVEAHIGESGVAGECGVAGRQDEGPGALVGAARWSQWAWKPTVDQEVCAIWEFVA